LLILFDLFRARIPSKCRTRSPNGNLRFDAVPDRKILAAIASRDDIKVEGSSAAGATWAKKGRIEPI